jgi:BNR repeat-like domain
MNRRTGLGAAVGMSLVVLSLAGSVLAVTSTGDSQANEPQVQGDPGSNATAVFPTNKQNEPTIAQNPVDPMSLIAGSNDEQRQPPCGPGPVRGPDVPESDCGFFPGVGTSGIYTSSDGGVTWTNRGLLDDQASWQGAGVISDGDPVIAYGPKPDGHGGFSYTNGARAYYSTLATVIGAKGFEYVVVSHSDDDGLTWSAPVIGTTKTSSADFNDKNWIDVDDSPSSPYFGRVYLSWTEFRSATFTGYGSEPMMVSASADGGASFGSPKQLSPAGNNGTGNGRQGSSIAVGPGGTVYVAFEQGFVQVVSISSDGGKKWTRPITIGSVADLDDPIPGSNFRTASFPTIAADPRPGSTTVYATWANRTSVGGRIVVATSTDSGRTWSAPVKVSGTEGYAFYQGMDVAPSGRVDIAYQAQTAVDPDTFGTGNASIDAYAVSKPAAGSWSDPVKISTASSDPAVSAQNNLQRQFWGDYSTLVSDDNGAWFISTDSRRGAGCADVDAYQTYLSDNGLAVRGDGADRLSYKQTGVNPALSDPSEKPAPPVVCPADFGDTDVFVARFTP